MSLESSVFFLFESDQQQELRRENYRYALIIQMSARSHNYIPTTLVVGFSGWWNARSQKPNAKLNMFSSHWLKSSYLDNRLVTGFGKVICIKKFQETLQQGENEDYKRRPSLFLV